MGDKKNKKAQMFVNLVSAAGTRFFYVKSKPRQFIEELELRKYYLRASADGVGNVSEKLLNKIIKWSAGNQPAIAGQNIVSRMEDLLS